MTACEDNDKHDKKKRLNVVVNIELMPKGVEVDMESIRDEMTSIVEEHGKVHSSEIKPIAFGLKSLHAALLLNDKESGMEDIERKLNEIEGVGEVKVLDMSLL